ncbi:MAG: S-methyl-5-thioribose-1-phosphate isomerase [Desulfovibrionaceae bacterium]|nr:S-methyl-5-thioribose-1-phosphate isomerase [Desulfovibrionaceae bacterium]
MKEHIIFDPETFSLKLLDQRFLPNEEGYFLCETVDQIITALKTMVVRGAPAIGVTAAFGAVIALKEVLVKPNWFEKFMQLLDKIANARPTAVNLSWAIGKMRQIAIQNGTDPNQLLPLLLTEANSIKAQDIEICQQIGAHGQTLIPKGATVMTHCNAGALATAGYGTALGVIRSAYARDKTLKVIANETRPFLQGARLTCYELALDGINVRLACDNACAYLMSHGYVDCVVVGADRIAANGDTANKIGTFGVALLAKHFKIPFYVAAPRSTIDLTLANGSDIPIEERPASEVRTINGLNIVPSTVPVYNFAFDVTEAEYISAIITEVGILRPPYTNSIFQAFAED